jgi:hypothetical protein
LCLARMGLRLCFSTGEFTYRSGLFKLHFLEKRSADLCCSGVHAYFVLQQALNVFQTESKYSCVCAQHQYVSLPHTERQARSKDETGPLLDNKGQSTTAVGYEEMV